VRQATFDPSSDLDPSTQYAVVFNPEQTLSVTDLAGNPFHRFRFDFFTE
jgi:hypothetical protein